MKDGSVEKGEKARLESSQNRTRYGCDSCRYKRPTEMFFGLCGSVLWLCHECVKEFQKWPKPLKANPFKDRP